MIFIIGGGPDVGKSVARKFAFHNYKVALAARSLSERLSTDGYLHIKADLLDMNSVSSIFQTVEETPGLPNVAEYNGSDLSHQYPFPHEG